MIIGFSLKEIEGKRWDETEGVVQVTYSSKIENIAEEEVKIYKDKVAKIEFTFEIGYLREKKEVGKIKFSGSLLWKGDLEEIMDNWKEKKIPDKLKTPVMNYIYRKCLINAVSLSESLNLPSPIPIPRIEFKK